VKLLVDDGALDVPSGEQAAGVSTLRLRQIIDFINSLSTT
jgi:hypothetical protein